MELYNKIAMVSLEKFDKLSKTGKPNISQWTILSTIVQENTITNALDVVSLGTGSKCIGENKMSMKGDVLNDSHAEIICRRSFLLYLYSQIKLSLENKSQIFDFTKSKFLLRGHVLFHFFTTHVPCGDAAIFPKSTEYIGPCLLSNEAKDEIPKKKLKLGGDVFRTGAKCLKSSDVQDPHFQGANYHNVSAIRTKPGRGDPTLSVSCSDKIAKWCYLGLQGALLSILLNTPIYLQSVTLSKSTPYSEESLQRALNKRFQKVVINAKFGKHDILINQADHAFSFAKVDSKQPCPSSVSWHKDMKKIEIAVGGVRQGITKKKLGTKKARLLISKIELYRQFSEIAHAINLTDFGKSQTYRETKRSATDYQDAWKHVKQKIFKVWTSKDPTFLEFKLD